MASPVLKAASTAGLLRRYKGADHPDTIAARGELATEQIADDIRRRLESAPPLTDAQRERLAGLLRDGAR